MDNEALVDTVTRMIMERIGNAGPACPEASVVTFGDVPACVIGPGLTPRQGHSPADVEGAQYIVLTQAAFRALHGGVVPAALGGAYSAPAAASAAPAAAAGCNTCGGPEVDLTGKKVIGDRDVRALDVARGAIIKVGPKAIVTALARDYVNGLGGQIVR